MEAGLFRTVGVAFALARVAKQPGASATLPPFCQHSRASSCVPASSTNARSARRASSDNSDATNAEPFAVALVSEDRVHIATSPSLWLTSCQSSPHLDDYCLDDHNTDDGDTIVALTTAGDRAGTSQPMDSCCGT